MVAQKPVLFFSLEMGHLELTQRLLQMEAKVDGSRLRNGNLSDDDWPKISRAVGQLAEAPIWIDDNPNLTVMEIRAKARRLKSRLGDLGVVVVDYLQLMSGRKGSHSREREIAEISRALKVMANNIAEDPESVQRFRREGSAARKITHPNVIRIHDLRDDAGLLFLSMEYFPGMTLAEMIMRRPVTPLNEVKRIVVQVCDALNAAHAAGVIHRDLKPQNILVNDQREVRVIDFGLAMTVYTRGMTATGMILGTPEYMSPEQVQGGLVDHRSDIYALGAVAYHLVTGRPPFVGDDSVAVISQHLNTRPVAPSWHNPEIQPELEALILALLEKTQRPEQQIIEVFNGNLLGVVCHWLLSLCCRFSLDVFMDL